MRVVILAFILAGGLLAEPAKVDTSSPVGQAFVRLYNFDFGGAHTILDQQIRVEPNLSLPYSVKAAAHLFSELHRLKILEMDFFADDERVIDRKKLTPDPKVRAEIFRLLDLARARANTRLSAQPYDREALFTLCISAGVMTDYAALVERRRFGSIPLARQAQVHANRLLALDPPFYDAYLTSGAAEYVLGCLPFFIRWFIHIDGVEGSKQKGMQNLGIVAQRGKYYGPFARILLAVIHLREARPQEAQGLLAGLASEYPENPLIRRELARVGEMARRSQGAANRNRP